MSGVAHEGVQAEQKISYQKGKHSLNSSSTTTDSTKFAKGILQITFIDAAAKIADVQLSI